MKEQQLTGQVNANGNRIGFIDEVFWWWSLLLLLIMLLLDVVDIVKLNELSPKTWVNVSPNVHGESISTLAWYCFKQMRNLVLQLLAHDPFGNCLSPQHRPRLFIPLSLRKDFNLNSNMPEHVICEIKERKIWIKNDDEMWKHKNMCENYFHFISILNFYIII